MRPRVPCFVALCLMAACTSRTDYNSARVVGDRFNAAFDANNIDAAFALGTPAFRAGTARASFAALIQRARAGLGACGAARPLGANFDHTLTTYVITLSYERTCSAGTMYENVQIDMKSRPRALAGVYFGSTNPHVLQDVP